MRKLLFVVALAYACSANAQQFDGTWTGTTARWNLTLKVTGAKARLEMTCAGSHGIADFAIGTDGAVAANTYVSFPSAAGVRHQITGTVQALEVSPAGSCGGGTATMTKKS